MDYQSVEGEDESGSKMTIFKQPLMERTGHPYARRCSIPPGVAPPSLWREEIQ